MEYTILSCLMNVVFFKVLPVFMWCLRTFSCNIQQMSVAFFKILCFFCLVIYKYIASVSTAASVPGRGMRFFLSKVLRPLMGLTQPPVQRVLGGVLFLQVKELGHIADCSPQFR